MQIKAENLKRRKLWRFEIFHINDGLGVETNVRGRQHTYVYIAASASEMTCIVSGGALNSTRSLRGLSTCSN